MPNITLSIPKDIHKMMKTHREVRWSEVARAAIVDKIKKLAIMEQIASKSKLTLKDISDINKKVKKGLHTELNR